jgi:hypothetical protein
MAPEKRMSTYGWESSVVHMPGAATYLIASYFIVDDWMKLNKQLTQFLPAVNNNRVVAAL